MSRISTYRPIIFFLTLAVLAGCNGGLNERFSLWRKDKIPYGVYYAFNHLQYLFRDAAIEISDVSPSTYNALGISDAANVTLNDSFGISAAKPSRSAFIVIVNSMNPHPKEIDALFNFVRSGNDVFISATEIGNNLLDSLRLKTPPFPGFYNNEDSLTVSILHPVTHNLSSFSYPGKAKDNYFSGMDSSITSILGRNGNGEANFVRFSYQGGGAIYLHLAPAAFTNFFLLHKKNKAYLDQALSYLPADIKTAFWDDYFRYHSNGIDNTEKSAFSKLQAFLKHQSLRWAFWLAIILFAIIYLFESKRKQRVVPVIAPLKNTSLDFVKTIGRLYFQRKDNKNLAAKMTVHFLDQVRNRYNISTSQLSQEFEKRLAYKSGYDAQEIKDILYHIKTLEDKAVVSDDELLELNAKLDKFYKQA